MQPKLALLSTYNTAGLKELAQELTELDFEFLAWGKAEAALREIEDASFSDEKPSGAGYLLGGRLRLLEPRLLAGIVADHLDAVQRRELETEGIEPLKLVCANLQPFEEMAEGAGDEDLLREFIDIGTVTVIRAAARNYPNIIVLTDPADYAPVIEKLKKFGDLPVDDRRRLAHHAFEHTAYYEASVASYFRTRTAAASLPEVITLRLKKSDDLRYGENPHQKAAVYSLPRGAVNPVFIRIVQGPRRLSFNNYLDIESAWNLLREFEETACVIIKHSLPVAVALGKSPEAALRRAVQSDPTAVSGATVAFNQEIDEETARAAAGLALDCLIAPGADSKSLDILKSRKELRVVLRKLKELVEAQDFDYRAIAGGFLVQEKSAPEPAGEFRVITRREPTEAQWRSLKFGWRVVKHVRSNAAALADENQTLAIGSGQTSAMDALLNALHKLVRGHKIIVRTDSPMTLAAGGYLAAGELNRALEGSGITAVVAPGQTWDNESIALADERGLCVIFASQRHFRH